MPGKIDGVQYRAAGAMRTDEAEGHVSGYATTFGAEYILGEDYDLRVVESVDSHAFDETDMKDVIFQYNHEGRVFARMSNGTLSLSVDDHGLKVDATLGGTEEGRRLYEEIKGGYTTRMSFGFTISKDSWTNRTGSDGKREMVRTILGVRKLYDVSAVAIPANDGTEISARCLSEARSRIDDGINRKEEAERLEFKYRLMIGEEI